MFKVEFLGHQSWLISTKKTRLVVDPLLFASFGNGPRPARFRRSFLAQKHFAVDAIVITHEHEDHFDLATLHLFARDTKIFISRRSSTSAFTILREMGFSNVYPLEHGVIAKAGDIKIASIAQGRSQGRADEWDVSPLLAFQDNGGGSFFTSIDVMPSVYSLHVAAKLLARNEKTFCSVSNKYFKHDLSTVYADLESLLKQSSTQASLLATPQKKERWLCQAKANSQSIFGSAQVSRVEWQNIAQHLNDFARYLYGRSLYQILCDSDKTVLPVKKSTLAIFLKSAGLTKIFEYNLNAGCFELSNSTGRPSDYAAAYEIWAKDYLALCEGVFEARILTKGRCRWFNQTPMSEFDFICETLWSYFHPLNQQVNTLKRYRAKWAEISAGAVRRKTGPLSDEHHQAL